jgi:hypothetical protein
MKKRCPWIVIGLWLFAVSPLSAATVSFLVVETGLPGETESSLYSSLWESGLFDVFFEAGHIVSNAPIKRLETKPQKSFPDEVKGDLNDAADGGAEYFILALLDYPQAAAQKNPKPRNIALRVFKISPYKLLYEQSYAEKNSGNIDEEFSTIKQSIRGLVPHLADK